LTDKLVFDEMPDVMPEEFRGTGSLWSRVSIYNGDELVKGKWEQAHSIVRNFMYWLQAIWTHTDATVGGWDQTNTLEGFEQGNSIIYVFRSAAEAALDTYGIMLGTDNTAVTLSDYALGVKIAHGEGAGELRYGDSDCLTPFEDSGDSYTDLFFVRHFINRSGGLITVEEIGLAVCNEDSGGSIEYFLMARDLKNFGIADDATAIVEYCLRFTV